MTQKHTPGTYYAEYAQRVVCGGVILATVPAPRSEGPGMKEEREANARLFAAAPDLLEANKQMLAMLEGWISEGSMNPQPRSEMMRIMNEAQAAIAKARGQS